MDFHFSSFALLFLIPTFLAPLALSVAFADDGAALIAVKEKWQANLSSWTSDGHPCQGWEGVICNDERRVISLNLSNKGIEGPIPDEIGHLNLLISLDLSNSKSSSGRWNNITGDLAAIKNLRNLQLLNMSFNYLNTEFPESVLTLTSLTFLKLDNAGIKGLFPMELTSLTNLQLLFLGNNSLQGPLPKGLDNLVNLEELSLWDNEIGTSIPTEIFKLKNLTYLNMHGCDLWGGLPLEFGNLSNMRKLHLYDNQLSGIIPETWKNMTNLSSLRLEYNYLTKFFPYWIQTLTILEHLDLQHNLFYGTVENVALTNINAKLVDIKCNYFYGKELASTNQTLLEDKGNCFAHANEEDKKRCSQVFYTCAEFFKHVKNADECPACPPNQFLLDATTCVCQPGLYVNKHTISIVKLTFGILILLLCVASLIIFIVYESKKKIAKVSSCPYSTQELEMFLYHNVP